ncbi:hypothetical protein [Streptomyces litchfieldiae]|uniref:Uncharacterized protein n=1 Tax=Streptomyces litchfieldiae TaxID=3075543 RepID=A0ABU2MWD0_9ACTN|nr:hypothetical protein [Streptomyces sp. DSM 44938]MDT0345900.1 hypothetical protein [Streptomyces sp. DSM 44938]
MPSQLPCDRCGRILWPDITVQGRPPMWVCPSCVAPQARFWHRHDGRRCPLGYPWPLQQDPAGRLFICC